MDRSRELVKQMLARFSARSIADLTESCGGVSDYEYPIRWYQCWRYHRVFAGRYKRSREGERLMIIKLAGAIRQRNKRGA